MRTTDKAAVNNNAQAVKVFLLAADSLEAAVFQEVAEDFLQLVVVSLEPGAVVFKAFRVASKDLVGAIEQAELVADKATVAAVPLKVLAAAELPDGAAVKILLKSKMASLIWFNRFS